MTKAEQVRLVAWRSKVLQQAADVRNVARVCRRFGISRKSFYKWKRRHAEHVGRHRRVWTDPNMKALRSALEQGHVDGRIRRGLN